MQAKTIRIEPLVSHECGVMLMQWLHTEIRGRLEQESLQPTEIRGITHQYWLCSEHTTLLSSRTP